MNTNLTQDQIDQYQRDECLILEEFFTEDEVNEVLEKIDHRKKQ